ncbi:MAG: Bax inhibitor-1 family protein [Acidobacteria bacterium]|nr:Bax inhibitor-1 family protein [Acidobacteriota bacterium]MBI3471571.1 Bax inhibitor-1 family protein [Candidatus Solibacter usitatus]
MEYYDRHLTVQDKLFGATTLAPSRAATLKKTYLLLSLSVVSAIAGGYVGATSEGAVKLFSSWLGWILAMLVLNIVPRIAMAARDNPLLGITALLFDGFLSGLVLAPILYLASVIAPGIVFNAMAMTALVFVGVTAYVMTANRSFSAPRGLMVGLFFSIIGAVVLNGFLHIGMLGMLISVAVGVMGVLILVYATSDVLNNPEGGGAISGALMLFAGLFNIFVAILNLLLSFGRSRD